MRISAALGLSILLASVANPQTKPAAVKAATPHAQWSAAVASVLSVPSEEAFKESGLYKLTPEELTTLMKDVGYLPRMTYDCGPNRVTAGSYDKIYAIVSFSDQTPMVIQSAILQGLRNISDLEIVYDRKDADKEIEFLGLETKSTRDITIGFTLSMAVTDPCSLTWGSSTTNPLNQQVDDLQDSRIFTGPNVEGVAVPAVAALDAGEFERVRKSNASLKKWLHPNQ